MPTPVDAPNGPITSNDAGMAAVQLGMHNDDHHVAKLKNFSKELQNLHTFLRKFAALKREIEAKNDGNAKEIDISELHGRLREFQDYYNDCLEEGEKPIDLNLFKRDHQDGLKEKSADDLEKIVMKSDKELEKFSKHLEDKLEQIRFKVTDTTNQVQFEGLKYTIVSQLFQELVKTEKDGKHHIINNMAKH